MDSVFQRTVSLYDVLIMNEVQSIQVDEKQEERGVPTPPLPDPPRPEELDGRESADDIRSGADRIAQVSSGDPLATPSDAVVHPADPEDDIAREDDVFTNNQYLFRVDQVNEGGAVRIRFRSDAHLDAKPFSSQKILDFLRNKKSAPEGDWLFGSKEEFRRFVNENGYRLEKRRRTEK